MSVPSIKTLSRRLGISEPRARMVRGLLKGELDTYAFGSVRDRHCGYGKDPGTQTSRLEIALNEVLDGEGIESISGEYLDSYYHRTQALYVNVADTYTNTLVFDCLKQAWLVSCFGDYLDYLERVKRVKREED